MKTKANLIEVFSSLQGEGAYVGAPTTFLRFGKCSYGCKWCDTPMGKCQSESFNIETPPRSGNFKKVPNPIGITELNSILFDFKDQYLSITGGEPLEQTDFLSEWLLTNQNRKIMLETNGILFNRLNEIIKFIDIISMDIKLPSSTGCQSTWDEHEKFLVASASSGKELYVKIVVTDSTDDRDVERAIKLVNNTNKFVPVYIQPASPTLTYHHSISEQRLHAIERICSAYLPNVSIQPQMHKVWKIL